MTPFWIWVAVGCQLSVALGFWATRYGIPGVRSVAGRRPERPRERPRADEAPAVVASTATVREPPRPAAAVAPPASKRRAAPARRSATAMRPAPAPTVQQPEAEKLALWARQVKAGERTFSLATDGCRVTWNRRCKHGHPSWLVHLGLLAPRQAPRRHRPR
jgi:hypothetical protein